MEPKLGLLAVAGDNIELEARLLNDCGGSGIAESMA